MNQQTEIFTQLYTCVAKAFNNLDYHEMEDIVADNIVYSSQFVIRHIEGKENVINYLKKKFVNVIISKDIVEAELAIMGNQENCKCQISGISEGDLCILLDQNNENNLKAVLILEKNDKNLISSIQILTIMPHWTAIKGTSLIPK